MLALRHRVRDRLPALATARAGRAATASRGLTAAPAVAARLRRHPRRRLRRRLPARCSPRPARPAPREACLGLDALGLWWQIQLDPDSTRARPALHRRGRRGHRRGRGVDQREPERAEAWFYLGAALRRARRSGGCCARSGSRPRATASGSRRSLERALALDPALDDAEFGIGLYRYYADVAPAVRDACACCCCCPAATGSRACAQMERASRAGTAGARRSGLSSCTSSISGTSNGDGGARRCCAGCSARYPHNPLFRQIEAEIHDVYFHDRARQPRAPRRRLLSLRASAARCTAPALAEVRARLNIAVQLDRARPARSRARRRSTRCSPRSGRADRRDRARPQLQRA